MEQPDRQFSELFQELKQEDLRRAPAFARVWANATARGESKTGLWLWLRLAVAALVLLVGLGAWFAFSRRAPDERIALPVTPPAKILVPAPAHEPSQVIAASPDKQVRQPKQRRSRPASRLPLETLVSQWRSPTDFLLKTPGERWLKEVPRLGVSHLELKPFVIEQNNEMEEL